ncbi:MAG: hypothetical protein AAGA54_12680 [Myxococcota bacterium]
MAQRLNLARHGPALLVALGVALFVSIRLQVFEDEVPNPDISGILYNADALLRGALPYVDNAEFKPLGSFYLVAMSFAAFGRDLGTLQWFYTGWMLLGAPALWFAVGPDDRSAPRRLAAALSVAVYLYYAGMFTYNYTSWMVPAYAWSYVGIVRGLRTRTLGWALLGGATAAVATVTMQRGAVLGPFALVLFGLEARRRGPAWTVLGGWIVGALLAGALLAAPYLVRGELGAVVEAIFPWRVVADYTAAPNTNPLQALVHLPGHLLTTFGAGLAVGIIALATELRSRERAWLAPAAFLVASIIGAGLGGGRFYLHYLVQLVPAVAAMAGSVALAATWLDETTPRWRLATAGACVAVLLGCAFAVSSGAAHRYEARARRLDSGKSAAQAAGAHIAARTTPEQRIYGWGWTTWRVYFWADRRAPGRYYKALGRLTTFNSNTAFDAGGDVVFRPGPHADAFIEDFDANPPTYVVLSPSFTDTLGARVDPLQDFTALRERLERGYRPEAQFGDLTLLRRVVQP